MTVTNEPCVFCEIVAGRLPKQAVHEDERTLSFLNINPATRGHTLVIPKRHWRNVFDADPEDLAAVARTGQVIALRQRERLKCDGVSCFQSNEPAGWQTVFHYHLHVVPRYVGDPLHVPWKVGGPSAANDLLAEVAAELR